jgi:uncharacterized protein (TIGR00645 family)
MKSLEILIERTILASRWMLVVFYLGLTLALGIYAITFMFKLSEFVGKIATMKEADAVLKMLSLIDAGLVASLTVMVIIASYENFVSKFDVDAKNELNWLGKIDAGSLKIKVASTIVAISSIHLLQVFLNVGEYANDKLVWLVVIHLAFVASAFILAWIDRIMSHGAH